LLWCTMPYVTPSSGSCGLHPAARGALVIRLLGSKQASASPWRRTPKPKEFFMLGDDAYKASCQVVTPYPGTSKCWSYRSFNFYHSRNRMPIERDFGV
jgi:hypothetical protein